MTFVYAMLVIALLGFLGLVAHNSRERALERASQKQRMIPQAAMPQEGICQCDDAFCYHDMTGCTVRNCPCKHYVPSTLTTAQHEQLTEAMLQTFTKRALTSGQSPPVQHVSTEYDPWDE